MRDDLRLVEGHRLRLRLVTPDDALYIHRLRTDPRYNAHLSEVTGTADVQRAWIERYKIREAAGEELYYVIERRDGVPCGVVRLYEIGTESFTWGSFILDDAKPAKAALEAAVLSFGIGFGPLDLPLARFDARLGNDRALSFYRRLGVEETGQDAENVYFEYSCDRYLREREDLWRVIEGGVEA